MVSLHVCLRSEEELMQRAIWKEQNSPFTQAFVCDTGIESWGNRFTGGFVDILEYKLDIAIIKSC